MLLNLLFFVIFVVCYFSVHLFLSAIYYKSFCALTHKLAEKKLLSKAFRVY